LKDFSDDEICAVFLGQDLQTKKHLLAPQHWIEIYI
jgi:hypothetical protein